LSCFKAERDHKLQIAEFSGKLVAVFVRT